MINHKEDILSALHNLGPFAGGNEGSSVSSAYNGRFKVGCFGTQAVLKAPAVHEGGWRIIQQDRAIVPNILREAVIGQRCQPMACFVVVLVGAAR